MKIVILSIISVLLISLTGKAQNNKDYTYPQPFSKFIHSDSLKLKLDTSRTQLFGLNKKSDYSLAQIFGPNRFNKFHNKIIPFKRNKIKQDIMVMDPGPSYDAMPNANVITPGVHYFLKVIPPKGQVDKDELPLSTFPE